MCKMCLIYRKYVFELINNNFTQSQKKIFCKLINYKIVYKEELIIT